jgi:hypothetical protein
MSQCMLGVAWVGLAGRVTCDAHLHERLAVRVFLRLHPQAVCDLALGDGQQRARHKCRHPGRAEAGEVANDVSGAQCGDKDRLLHRTCRDTYKGPGGVSALTTA